MRIILTFNLIFKLLYQHTHTFGSLLVLLMHQANKHRSLFNLSALWGLVFCVQYLPYIAIALSSEILNIISIILLILFIATVFLLLHEYSRIFHERPSSLLGLNLDGAKYSLRIALIFAIIAPIRLTAFMLLGEPKVLSIPPWLAQTPKLLVPIVAMLRWFAGGLTIFSMLMGFTVEILDRHKVLTRRNIFLIFVCLCLLYNAPLTYLLFGELITVSLIGEIIDVIMLGVALLIYLRTRNAIGIIIIYTFVYEAPVNTAVLYGWGPIIYIVYLLFWTAIFLINVALALRRKSWKLC